MTDNEMLPVENGCQGGGCGCQEQNEEMEAYDGDVTIAWAGLPDDDPEQNPELEVIATGWASQAVGAHIDKLVADRVASRLFAQDATLWGPAAEAEASIRLGWTQLPETSRALVEPIVALRDELRAAGIDRVVLAGMGGSSLAPEVIAGTYGQDLVVLDSTDPDQVARGLAGDLARTVLVVSSKSGGTVETDSQRRIFEKAFADAGLDVKRHIVVVTDPGSPLHEAATAAGYRVFEADPTVGGRFSALTAFGLVPTGLAGVDIAQLLTDAAAVAPALARDAADNPGLVLGAALAGTKPLRDKLVLVDDESGLFHFGDWAEQLVAESTGKDGVGLLPVVVGEDGPEVGDEVAADVLPVVLFDRDSEEVVLEEHGVHVGAKLGAAMLLWEVATAVAGVLLRINPFDQPNVESAKAAARELLDNTPEPEPYAFVEDGIEVRAGAELLGESTTVAGAVEALLGKLGARGYLAVMAYLDREGHSADLLAPVRAALAARTGRPVTFGWGPRFLHSTGQLHKGGAPDGVFLQITGEAQAQLDIPGRSFDLATLIAAQAAGDAAVLAGHHLPVLRLHVTDSAALQRLASLLSA
ncbi:glucose-6-phosphate isomerase [Buchananella hordeovulneris]|uniref:glucose-6-phosphate isomerase n=1 Tax=Buchananella hordeovulneris TaxID=52770 RepID=UPI0026DC6181|nr:glucose-6-phosphate isomerase [Buchananella hordeovulneris]MDO5079736.1 glucose-6-phosphate isomerase [Buchananella hordeovulneris]